MSNQFDPSKPYKPSHFTQDEFVEHIQQEGTFAHFSDIKMDGSFLRRLEYLGYVSCSNPQNASNPEGAMEYRLTDEGYKFAIAQGWITAAMQERHAEAVAFAAEQAAKNAASVFPIQSDDPGPEIHPELVEQNQQLYDVMIASGFRIPDYVMDANRRNGLDHSLRAQRLVSNLNDQLSSGQAMFINSGYTYRFLDFSSKGIMKSLVTGKGMTALGKFVYDHMPSMA